MAVVLLALLDAVPARRAVPRHPVVAAESGSGPGAAPVPAAPALAGPCAGVVVAPVDDLQRAVDAHPPGTTFCLEAGVHRLAQAVPKDGQRFIGTGQATILSGARVLAAADARRDGAGHWYWEGQTQRSQPHGTLIGSGYAEVPNPGDRYHEELFVTASGSPRDSPRRYRRVLELADLGPGRWYLDETSARRYLSDDPARLGLIETSVTPSAIAARPGTHLRDVLVENLVVEKYASPAQQAALGGEGARDWDLRDLTVRDNHGAGAELGAGTLMEDCAVLDNGQVGLIGGGNAATRPTVLRNSEVAHNATLSFDPDWEAGGAKFTRVGGAGMLVENSWFHDDLAGGLWFDIDNDNVVIRSNRFQANDRWGLLYEVSRHAQIYWNEVSGTSDRPEGFPFSGAGILISNSAEVDVYGNLLRDNDNGVLLKEDRKATRWAQDTYRAGIPHIDQVAVHDNDIGMRRGVTGTRVENGDPTAWWRRSHASFADNTYRLDATAPRFLGPGNDLFAFDQWTALGNDPGSVALPAASAAALPDGAAPFTPRPYGARP
jgi:hypothetical protein